MWIFVTIIIAYFHNSSSSNQWPFHDFYELAIKTGSIAIAKAILFVTFSVLSGLSNLEILEQKSFTAPYKLKTQNLVLNEGLNFSSKRFSLKILKKYWGVTRGKHLKYFQKNYSAKIVPTVETDTELSENMIVLTNCFELWKILSGDHRVTGDSPIYPQSIKNVTLIFLE